MSAVSEQQDHTLILFDEKNEDQAFDEAQKLRENGTRVTLQFGPAVKATDEFSKHFSKVLRLEGAN
ncbi:hypothetical protein [Planococcus halocryophilus]